MANALTLSSGFVECLFLVLAVDAVRRGRRMYAAAVLGIALVLYGRMADGFISSTSQVVVVVVGLLLAGVTVTADLLFEVVQEGAEATVEEPGPSV